MKCPERYATERLLLRRPLPEDAAAMFSTYAGDPAVGKYLSWPIHQDIAETRHFIEISDNEWQSWPGGPYLVFTRHEQRLVGSTGFAFESAECASTGYVIAKCHWGNGFASEALGGITEIAASVCLDRLYALCHPEHAASQRVLQKCGFREEAYANRQCVFPNQAVSEPQDVLSFCWQGPGQE